MDWYYVAIPLIAVFLLSGIRIIRPTNRGLVERLGKYRRFAAPVYAGGILLAFSAACACGPAAVNPAGPIETPRQVAAPPDDDPASPVVDPAPPVAAAAPAQPAPAEKTAGQLAQELRESLEAEKRRGDAQAALARYAAVEVEHDGLVITIPGDVLFATEQATLLPSSQPLMTNIADALLVTSERDLIVESYADASGPVGSAVDLSRARAEAVQTFLVAQGYPADRIRAKGIGQDHPVASNASANGRAKNRRVEILVSFEQDVLLQGNHQ
ncbi:MAG TPA: OmpA family protein [Polyangia bacterium]|nr:OmpA family protein [Polyangia bacterium]